jgi:hypothetical protein
MVNLKTAQPDGELPHSTRRAPTIAPAESRDSRVYAMDFSSWKRLGGLRESATNQPLGTMLVLRVLKRAGSAWRVARPDLSPPGQDGGAV